MSCGPRAASGPCRDAGTAVTFHPEPGNPAKVSINPLFEQASALLSLKARNHSDLGTSQPDECA